MQSSKNPSGTTSAIAFLVIRNDGQTGARDIRLTADREFRKPDDSIADAAYEALKRQFSGEVVISTLNPGRQLKYILDMAQSLLAGTHDPYRVQATYTDPTGRPRYVDDHVIDVEPWRFSIAEEAPLRRISKDLQRIGDEIKKLG